MQSRIRTCTDLVYLRLCVLSELTGSGPIPTMRFSKLLGSVRNKENVVNSVFCCFLGKSTKYSQNPSLVNQFSATPRGQLNWTGPSANRSNLGEKKHMTSCIEALVDFKSNVFLDWKGCKMHQHAEHSLQMVQSQSQSEYSGGTPYKKIRISACPISKQYEWAKHASNKEFEWSTTSLSPCGSL